MTSIAAENLAGAGRAATGGGVSRLPWRYRAMIGEVRKHEEEMGRWTGEKILSFIGTAREEIREAGLEGEEKMLMKHLAGVFAAVSVVAKRELGMRPYDVQLVGGYELNRGRVAEMATGEGKTLVATLPATLNAITGRGVHVVTVNDYLAKRDAELMGPVYKALGLTVGVVIAGLSDEQRRFSYRADVVYGTNKEFGFDYLRDQIKVHAKSKIQKIDTLTLLNRTDSTEPVMRQLNFGIVDEADSVLIDESRTPLIVASATGVSPLAWAYEWANRLAMRFRARHDFEFEPAKRKLDWKEEGLGRLQKILAETNTPTISGENWQGLIINALRARHLYLREQQYVIANDDVVIVDEFTGRRMVGRTWSEGLQQAIQAKEKLVVTSPTKTLARTTYQHFFTLYKKLSGMTGTAATEAREFKRVYGLSVMRIPTHRVVKRERLGDRVFRTQHEKWLGIALEILKVRGVGNMRPILIGTGSIEDSEALARVLKEKAIGHAVLNARPENAEREAEIVEKAGALGAVTIATNMAGRGTDIRIVPAAAAFGGLLILGTQLHESRRIDDQLIGRSGRQGDPGAARFFLSLQDKVLEHLFEREELVRLRRTLTRGVAFGAEVRAAGVRRLFAKAQRKVEMMHYRQRENLMEYEDWLNKIYHQMGS